MSGEYDEAIEIMGKLLEVSPGSWYAHLMQALCYYKLRRDREAFEAIGRTQALWINDLSMYVLRMQILLRNGAFDEVRDTLQYLEEAGAPEDISLDFVRAQLLELADEDIDGAFRAYQAISRRVEEGDMLLDGAALYYRMANLMAQKMDLEQESDRSILLSMVDKGLALESRDEDCLGLKAWLLVRSGKLDEAIGLYQEIDTPAARRALADLYYEDLDRFAGKALEIYEELLQVHQTPELSFYAATCCYSMGDLSRAEHYAKRAIEMDDADMDAWRVLAFLAEYRGDHAQAKEYVDRSAQAMGPLPDNVQFRGGNHLEVHNVYGHLMAQATYEGLLKLENRRPFVLTRACCAGSQRYCSGWTGDNHSLWSHIQLSLVQMMNLGLSGMYMNGSDIGGFGSDCTPELLVRWTQAGCLAPFFRNHYAKGTRAQEPYAFDEKTMELCRDAINLRYHLLPYIYDLAHEDMPILRPMVLEYPDDPECANLSDQYLVGDKLLVAPVMTPGVSARAVYLPKGTWYDYYTGKRYTGGKYILTDAPLGKLPLFAKAGAILPVSVGQPQSVEDIQDVALEVFPGTGRFVHYTDDGESNDYLNGAYHALEIVVHGSKVTQAVIHNEFSGDDQLNVSIKA